MLDDPTLDPNLDSWVPVPAGSDFPIQNLPFGVFSAPGRHPHPGVRIGDHILDLALVEELFEWLPRGIFSVPTLNPFLSLGRPMWRRVRRRISEILVERPRGLDPGEAVVPMEGASLHRPIEPGDYVDFYSSLHHALNVGQMFRPQDPLHPNWRTIPVGYHGRAGTVVVSGTPVRRPSGMVREGPSVVYRPSRRLDYELELGYVTGSGNPRGTPIPVEAAEEHVFGVCLVNDWSARDIQSYEYQPLGPFLAKSFQTTMSPWLVDLDALAPFRVDPPPQDPPPPPHLRSAPMTAIDIELEVEVAATVVSRSNYREMYWTIAQQIAHATSNGSTVRPGDLWASGTVSGPTPGSEGCLLELTRDGSEPIRLADGAQRTYLEDGDTVVLRARCEAPGAAALGFGECRGTVAPARADAYA